MKCVTESGKNLNLTPGKMIGSGGEAEIYQIDSKFVAKIFKDTNHPDFTGQPALKNAQNAKLAQYQTKLKDFPKSLPPAVVGPLDLIYNDGKKKLLGYTMNFISHSEVAMKLADRRFREQGAIGIVEILKIYREIHQTLTELHRANVVVGDFNDLNIMFKMDLSEIFFIDTDSYQFGRYLTPVYTEKFVDPLKCTANNLALSLPHDRESDWYGYACMLFEALLYCGPYGGLHKPKNGKRLGFGDRVMQRVSVFNAEVQYPKPAMSLDILEPQLRKHFQEVFERDLRNGFPAMLLDTAIWHKCPQCGTEHGVTQCPTCNFRLQMKVKVHEKISVREVLVTNGFVLYASFQSKMRFIYWEEDQIKRENRMTIMKGLPPRNVRFRVSGERTIMANSDKAVILEGNQLASQFGVQKFNGVLPLIDGNSQAYFYVWDDQIWKEGGHSLGQVIGSQTAFWTGEHFGFGFYRTLGLTRGFVFNLEHPLLNDTVKIELPGVLLDSTCSFTSEYCWFASLVQEGPRRYPVLHVINKSGQIVEMLKDPHWLVRIRGNGAIGKFYFVATDDGLFRYEIGGNEKTFSNTENLMDSDSGLFLGDGGIYVVDGQKITHLTI